MRIMIKMLCNAMMINRFFHNFSSQNIEDGSQKNINEAKKDHFNCMYERVARKSHLFHFWHIFSFADITMKWSLMYAKQSSANEAKKTSLIYDVGHSFGRNSQIMSSE